ncbi:D-alanyl-D-alanine carboxypeptidase [Candidatus Rhodobacter oscarellae]|uniref:serine-type D-Ala-D-Ala carboxypeptidase n=1 Tax=Candidatus Rhodobacter oscarellae TaxID=1675527 RepID=A0A0J9E7D2_9RHOB|nr:D-alanyl-D-alanine carboxypeptidase family protein [Candidatus Rhodobacter lobularis]KMW57699.1 D-alanyl-D-alanine carboxypeptidase [Candidatus Rhodobacter lobularis]
MRSAPLLAALVLSFLTTLPGWAFDTSARAAYVYDVNTETVLMAKDIDQPLPPASMSKLMTLNMLFEALRDGRVSLDTRFTVSTKARNMGGSTMFLTEQDRPTVEELIKGIIVLSGNDACVAVAEGLAGTEEAFAQLMNQRAKALGMNNSTFANSSGWPHPNQRMSMRDLGTLATRLIQEFPEYYGYFAMTEFEWDGRAPQNRFNRNPLLKLGIGADGLKTGHTSEAGYGLVGSALQANRRVIFVLSGLDSQQARAQESERVVNWAFRQFVERTIVEKDERVAEIPVWLGEAEKVGVLISDEVRMLIPALVQGEIPGEMTYRTPLEAPITKGQVIGELIVRVPDMPEARVDLIADRDVARGGFMPRVRTAARLLFARIAGTAAELL